MNITWQKKDGDMAFSLDGSPLGVAVGGGDDQFSPVPGGILWTRRVDTPVDQMALRFETAFPLQWEMTPGVRYGGNTCYIMDYSEMRRLSHTEREGDALEPNYFKGYREERSGEPWKIAWFRMSVPGGIYAEGDGLSAAMFLPRGQRDGSASVYPQEDRAVLELSWPVVEGPRAFAPHMQWLPERRDQIAPRTEFSAVLVFAPADCPKLAWHQLVDAAWDCEDTRRDPKFGTKELWDLGIAYAKSLYLEEEDGFCGFDMGYKWIDGRWQRRPIDKFELGWCGQNASLANSLLVHALRCGDKEAETMALRTLDSWVLAKLPQGILPTHCHGQEFKNGYDRTVDACNLGEGAIQFFLAEDLAKKLGYQKPEYGEAARQICDFALQKMQPSGRIGKSWRESDLTPIVEDGSTGAFLTLALIEAARRTGREDYREGAVRSFDYYYREFLENGFTRGGALDIFSIDKESCIPMLKGGLMLYDLTGDRKYVDCSVNGAYYLSTWQWHYTRTFPRDSVLGKLGYDTFGGTSVSIHGGHDPYALYYVPELLRLAELTGERRWRERARAIWANGMDGVSRGDLTVNGKTLPPGSQHEARGVTGWDYEDSVYEWLVAWPGAFRLEILREDLI